MAAKEKKFFLRGDKWKIAAFLGLFLAAFFVAACCYGDYLLSYGEKVFTLSPGETEKQENPEGGANNSDEEEKAEAETETDLEPSGSAGEEPEPGTGEEEPPDEELGGDKPSPYPPPPGEILKIKDGDYLLALVTKQTTLGDYAPTDLVPIPAEYIKPAQRQWKYYLRQEACENLIRMCEAAREEGVELFVISAYRSYETQERLFRDYAQRNGEEKANTFSARAGQSEHQLGTVVDFGGTSVDKTQAFADTQPGRWLAENAHRFGFAMSYPLDSQRITGYIYEPWHFRYIGEESALAWKESGQVLCVFLEGQEQFWEGH
ncbi:MAG: M15 family metallopeptidase [Firmicutes bacterium]|nr:M15 family metallopeptidase [Bacillota bacterium]